VPEADHAGAEEAQKAEDGDDVHVGEHRGLAVELLVDVGLRGVGAGSGHGLLPPAVAAEEALQLADAGVEGTWLPA
jgi:hypothetical protein